MIRLDYELYGLNEAKMRLLYWLDVWVMIGECVGGLKVKPISREHMDQSASMEIMKIMEDLEAHNDYLD